MPTVAFIRIYFSSSAKILKKIAFDKVEFVMTSMPLCDGDLIQDSECFPKLRFSDDVR